MKTLADLNESPQTRDWSSFTVERKYAVGTCGRHGSGSKTHLQFTEIVLADSNPLPHHYKVGSLFTVQPFCNMNGSHNGRVIARLDTKDINCQKCLKALERLS